jgi:hypothetical protein
MAGLAALEVAQTVLSSWQAMREARQEVQAGEQGAEALPQGEQLQAPSGSLLKKEKRPRKYPSPFRSLYRSKRPSPADCSPCLLSFSVDT